MLTSAYLLLGPLSKALCSCGLKVNNSGSIHTIHDPHTLYAPSQPLSPEVRFVMAASDVSFWRDWVRENNLLPPPHTSSHVVLSRPT